jgi:signal transduction histidine kinase
MAGNQASDCHVVQDLLWETQLFAPPPTHTEAMRLETLREYDILDTPPEAPLDDLTRLAAYVCGTPIALLSLLDADREWFKSRVGLGTSETGRALSFCAHAIRQPDLLVVPDATADARFARNPLVTGYPNIRFYAGAPLLTASGAPLGTLSVVDHTVRELTVEQAEMLRALARQVMVLLELRRRVAELKRTEEQQRFLAGASGVLGSSLDYDATLTSVVGLATPALADYCVIHVPDPDGTLRRVALAHADSMKSALLRELDRRFPVRLTDEHPVCRALKTGRTEHVAEVPEEMVLTTARDDRPLEVFRGSVRSFIVVPLVARGRTLGVVSFVRTESGRRYGAAEVALGEELGQRAAFAIDNARLYQESQAAVQARDTFLARASHELRTPLTSVLGTIRLLKRAFSGALDEPPETLVEIASRNLVTMSRFIDDLLDVSKLSSGEPQLLLETFDLAGVVAESLEVVAPQAREKGVLLRSSLPAAIRLPADRLKLSQVLVNLLGNAVKFTPAGGEVSVEAQAESGHVLLRVRDTGGGIPGEDIGRIFEPFVQAGEPEGRYPVERRARRGRGTGLGLAICRQIVELHGGQIWAESEGRGKGSTFSVRLPSGARVIAAA